MVCKINWSLIFFCLVKDSSNHASILLVIGTLKIGQLNFWLECHRVLQTPIHSKKVYFSKILFKKMFFSQFFDSFMNQKDEEVIKKID